MKKLLILCFALMVTASLYAQEEPNSRAFSNLGISLNGSTAGIGLTLSTPLANHFALRAGYQFSYLSYKYKYKDFDPIYIEGQSISIPTLGLDSKLNVDAAHIMVDWIPFKKGQGKFFVTAGFFVGGSDLLSIKGQFDMNDPNIREIQQAGLLNNIEVDIDGNVIRANPDGSVDAKLKVNSFRPYVGLGWGRAIPKHRFGFRFELGAIFHGKPEIASSNLVKSDDIGEVNEVINKIIAYPQLSFQLTYKLFKDR